LDQLDWKGTSSPKYGIGPQQADILPDRRFELGCELALGAQASRTLLSVGPKLFAGLEERTW